MNAQHPSLAPWRPVERRSAPGATWVAAAVKVVCMALSAALVVTILAGVYQIGYLAGGADLDRWMRGQQIMRFQKVYECPAPGRRWNQQGDQ